MHTRTWLLPLLLTLASCNTATYFRPTEKVSAESEDGFPAAEYELADGPTRWGELRLWSGGAEVREMEGEERTVLIVGFEVENTSDAAIHLEVERPTLDGVFVTGTEGEAESAAPPSRASVEADTVQVFQFVFPLLSGVRPKDIGGFRLPWSVRDEAGASYRQFTNFVRLWVPSASPYYGYYGYGYYGFRYRAYCW